MTPCTNKNAVLFVAGLFLCPILINYELYLLFKKCDQTVREACDPGHRLHCFAVLFVKAHEDVVVCFREVIDDTVDIGFHVLRELNV